MMSMSVLVGLSVKFSGWKNALRTTPPTRRGWYSRGMRGV